MSKRANKSSAVARSSRQPRILLVDDEDDIIRVLRSVLHRIGIAATIFNDPQEALREFRPSQYDLAIIDIRMPGMNGYELVKKLKSIDNELKTCFLTAFEIEEEDLIQNGITDTIDCSIRKPINPSDFIKRVNRLLEGLG